MKNETVDSFLATHSAKSIIDTLEPYILDKRRQRIEQVLSGRLNSIQLAIEQPADINNAFATIRTAEALGVSDVHLICPEGTTISAKSVTIGAVYWVNCHFHESLDDFLNYCHTHSLLLAGGLPSATMPLHEVPIEKPLCLFMGNEQRGLTPTAAKACDYQYTIPMVGMSESMNLSVSSAISLYDTTTRKRALLKQSGDLPSEEKAFLRAKYYLNSVSHRLVNGLLSPPKSDHQ